MVRLVACAALLVAACGAAVPAHRALLPPPWRPVRTGARAAWRHADGGTIAANATCGDADDVPLDVLTNHLLFGIEDKRERGRLPLQLAGRAGLRTRLDGTLDGVRVALDLVVLKKDGCTFDLMLIAPPGTRREPDFDRFVASFEPELLR